MALYMVLLSTILAFSLATTKHNVLFPGPNIYLSPDSMKNALGHWITRVDTGRYTMKENLHPLSENVHQGTSNKTEQLAHLSLHDTAMSGAVQPPVASTSTTNTITTPKSCPQSGYQLFQEFNCYKVFSSYDEWKNWSEAREQCKRDGGDLIVMETERERVDVYIPLYKSVDLQYYPWVGVYIAQGGDNWMTVKGQPALSTWWQIGYPDGDSANNCAVAGSTGLLLNNNCEADGPFICEIPV